MDIVRSRVSLLLAVAPSVHALFDQLLAEIPSAADECIHSMITQVYLAHPHLVHKLPRDLGTNIKSHVQVFNGFFLFFADSVLKTSRLDTSLHRLVVALLEVRPEETNSPAALHSNRTHVAYRLLRNIASNHPVRTLQ